MKNSIPCMFTAGKSIAFCTFSLFWFTYFFLVLLQYQYVVFVLYVTTCMHVVTKCTFPRSNPIRLQHVHKIIMITTYNLSVLFYALRVVYVTTRYICEQPYTLHESPTHVSGVLYYYS